MNQRAEIFAVDEVVWRVRDYAWDFEQNYQTKIAGHWRDRVQQKPLLFDGKVLLASGYHLVHEQGRVVLRGDCFVTRYSVFLSFMEWGRALTSVYNFFAMAALKSADGKFLLGEMAAHTANAFQIYFPSGTPDMQDVFNGEVDLDASARRELQEETGLTGRDGHFAKGWVVVRAAPHLAFMKLITLKDQAVLAKQKIETFLSRETKPELAAIHIADEKTFFPQAPGFISEFLGYESRGF